MKNLFFSILTRSSEDPEFRADNLSNFIEDKAKIGWASQRFCLYPQQITLQFPAKVRLSKVQFVFHEKKIPSRVQLFSYLPGLPQLLTQNSSMGDLKRRVVGSGIQNQNNFQRIGHFSVGDNSQKKWKVREMRSVHIDKGCQYLRLMFRENHPNKFNIFNQVALISLRCKGTTLSSDHIVKSATSILVEPSFKKTLVLPDNQREKNLPEVRSSVGKRMTQIKVKSTHVEQIEQKIQALRNSAMTQDEKEGKIEQKVRRLEEAKFQIEKLEFEKAKQLENQEYQKAKLLKLHIEKLKQEALLTPLDQDQTQSKPDHSSLGVFKGALITLDPIKNQKFVEESEFIQVGQNVQGENVNIVVKNQETKTELKIQNNDSLIPSAIGNGKVIDFNTVGEEDFAQQQKPSKGQEQRIELQPVQKQLLAPLLEIFQNQQHLISPLFSKSWMNREKALRFLKEKMPFLKAQENGLQSLLIGVNLGLRDKNSQVITRALDLYQDALSQFNDQMNKKGIKSDSGVYETIHLQLFDKLGDSNSKVKSKALQAAELLFTNSSFSSSSVFQFFLKRQSYLKAGSFQNQSHLLGRLELINILISQKDVGILGLPVNATLDFIVLHCLRISPQKKMRELCIKALVILYQQIGFKKMEHHLTDKELPDQLKDILRTKIPELDDILPQKKKYEGVGLFKTRNGEEEKWQLTTQV